MEPVPCLRHGRDGPFLPKEGKESGPPFVDDLDVASGADQSEKVVVARIGTGKSEIERAMEATCVYV